MKLIWFFGLTFNLIVSIYAGPALVAYNGDGCDCQSSLLPSFESPLSKYPSSYPYKSSNNGYKIDAPPLGTKAKLTYTIDFIVEEPKPKYHKNPEKLNLLSKVDRIVLKNPDYADAYIQPTPPPTPQQPQPSHLAPSPCSCGQSSTKPLYGFVDEPLLQQQPCRCQRPSCNCHLLQSPSSINIGNPVLIANDPSHDLKTNSRRKRDLEEIFFPSRRQDRVRSPRYIKVYNKPLNDQKETEKENWFNMDLFSNNRPLKRKTKRALLSDFRSKIVKRDIKDGYDLLGKHRRELDLNLPELIQFMPETIQPVYKRQGSCQFGCGKKLTPTKIESGQDDEKDDIYFQISRRNNLNERPSSTSPTPSTMEDTDYSEGYNSFIKRNANDWRQPNAAAQHLNDQSSQIPTETSNDQKHLSAAELCQQRHLYSAMKHAAESKNKNDGDLGYKYVPNPPPLIAAPEPLVGAPKYPVQRVPNASIDRLISDIVYRHPGFIEASSHYGGALVDPAADQAEQTKSLIKKLISGRLGLIFDKPEEQYMPPYPGSNYGSPSYNPNIYSRQMSYIPAYYSR